ncbi:MAG: 7-cyano-7-deazaguanine synthase QueC [Pseudomonadota bacterium]
MDAVIILSGGMDSAVLLTSQLPKGTKLSAISFDYGAKHNHREIPMAAALCRQAKVTHTVVALPFVNELFVSDLLISGDDVPDGAYDAENMKQTVVPFRNGIMLAIAAGYAESLGASRLLIGSHSGDHAIYPDCRPPFTAAMGAAIAAGTGNQVALEVPFAALDKRDIGDLGRRLGVDFRQTWTCYKGGQIHCGTCGACDERKYALRWEEGLDPTEYEK